MTTAETIQPALTPEEWAMVLEQRERFGPTTLTHAQAAMALYGQPFGFTRKEFDALGRLAEFARVNLPGMLVTLLDISRIGQKIAALLPPE